MRVSERTQGDSVDREEKAQEAQGHANIEGWKRKGGIYKDQAVWETARECPCCRTEHSRRREWPTW